MMLLIYIILGIVILNLHIVCLFVARNYYFTLLLITLIELFFNFCMFQNNLAKIVGLLLLIIVSGAIIGNKYSNINYWK